MPDNREPSSEELERRLRAAFGDREEEEPGPHLDPHAVLPDTSEFDDRLAKLRADASGLRKQHETAKQTVETRRATEQSDARGLGNGLQIAYAIIGFPLIGFGAGALVDKLTGSAFLWKGLLGLCGCVLAVFCAVILINKANREG